MAKKRFQPKGLQEVVDEFTELHREYEIDHKGLPLDEAVGVWRQALEIAVETAWIMLLSVRGIARSPIEERFLAALWVSDRRGDVTAVNSDGSAIAWRSDPSASDWLRVTSQAEVGPYRADFLVELGLRKGAYPKFPNGTSVAIAVELDGHDFHEKTKAQAAHDKKRDRFFAAAGLTCLRFTGSEVFKDGAACAEEVQALLSKKMAAKFGERP